MDSHESPTDTHRPFRTIRHRIGLRIASAVIIEKNNRANRISRRTTAKYVEIDNFTADRFVADIGYDLFIYAKFVVS